MLPLNRVYTPQELRAASRLTPNELNAPIVAHRAATRPAALRGGRGLAALRQRLFARAGLRRSAPSAT